jgi:hypothetical protein
LYKKEKHTYRLYVHACKRFDELHKIFRRIIDTIEKHRLVTHDYSVLEKTIGSFASDPRDLIDMVDVRMQTDLLGHLSAFVRELDEGVCPGIGFVCYAAWGHSKAFGSETNALNVRDA